MCYSDHVYAITTNVHVLLYKTTAMQSVDDCALFWHLQEATIWCKIKTVYFPSYCNKTAEREKMDGRRGVVKETDSNNVELKQMTAWMIF